MDTNNSWLPKYVKDNPLQVIGLIIIFLLLVLIVKINILTGEIITLTARINSDIAQEYQWDTDHTKIQEIKTKLDAIEKSVDTTNLNMTYLLTK